MFANGVDFYAGNAKGQLPGVGHKTASVVMIHAIFLRFVDRHLHTAFRHDHAHAVMTVNNRRGEVIAHDLKLGFRLLDFLMNNPVLIDGFQAADAVGVDAAFVGCDQHVGAGRCVAFRNANAFEDIDHKLLHLIERDMVQHKKFSGIVI